MQQRGYDNYTCVIVVRVRDAVIGLVVDTVDEVLDIPEDAVSPPPTISEKKRSRYIKGIGKTDHDVKIILDVNKLLFEEELASLKIEN